MGVVGVVGKEAEEREAEEREAEEREAEEREAEEREAEERGAEEREAEERGVGCTHRPQRLGELLRPKRLPVAALRGCGGRVGPLPRRQRLRG